jgi:hypothetical protein
LKGKVKFFIQFEMSGGVWWFKLLNALYTCTWQVLPGYWSDTPHFRIKFELSFLYNGGQLCTGVSLFKGIFLHEFFLQIACSLDKGREIQEEQSVSC